MAQPAHPKKRSIIYVDGFNLYYGALRGGRYKWLNLQKYFQLLRPADDIQAIRYFTALVHGPTKPSQQVYLKTLETLPLVTTILGKFKVKQISCRLTACTFTGSRIFSSQEEKRTDVNIAIQMLDDAYQDRCDRLVLVSGDSDLVPAVNLVKQRFPGKEVVVYVPARNATRGAATELRASADKHRLLPLNLLAHAQLPAAIPDGSGGIIHKPASW